MSLSHRVESSRAYLIITPRTYHIASRARRVHATLTLPLTTTAKTTTTGETMTTTHVPSSSQGWSVCYKRSRWSDTWSSEFYVKNLHGVCDHNHTHAASTLCVCERTQYMADATNTTVAATNITVAATNTTARA